MRPRYVDRLKWRSRPIRSPRTAGLINTRLEDTHILAQSRECADRLAELADALAVLARMREDALFTQAALIFRGLSHATATCFADLLGDEEEAPR